MAELTESKFQRKRNMTLEKLARIVAKGFEETAKKREMDVYFQRVDEKFIGLENRLGALENKFAELVKLLHRKEEEISLLSSQIKQLEERVAKLEASKR